MSQLKTAAIVILAVILQAALRNLWQPVRFLDLPLIVVVYYSLQRDALRALIVAAACGIGTDAVGAGGLIGSTGIADLITAFAIFTVSSRMMVDNPLARIPILAGAAIIQAGIVVLLNRALGNAPMAPFVNFAAYKVIATTAVGAIILFSADVFISDRANQRRQHASRRKVARRHITSLARRR
jgi:rod shape-determining protein MreD